ncbi:diguanylate cyclase [Geomonas sp. Red32]|uniref:diguanylate cyclase n=1 Tax=Geomonas sp. Red32 TaxID=2912856 RepID=UPI00202CE7C6|nr:diguanylate cyclase [Geomonas sp. Red32]MCM0082390.1 diguanylate cyclase [Geomonas sp. Red32]
MNTPDAQKTRQRVLIVDDTLANIEILYKILQDDYDVFFAKSGIDGLKVVQRDAPDLILLDIMMPDMDGYQVCEILKKDPVTAPIPVIFVTAMGRAEDETRGLDCGAIDYITKPISVPIVKARVRNHLELKRSRDLLNALSRELAEKNRELEVLARADGLTGIANRRTFDETVSAEIKRAVRSRQPLSLILFDIDFFKQYNDCYGHVAGDHCLQTMGALMRETFRRAGDLTARYGGEEFVVVLPDTTPAKAAKLADRLREELQKRAIPHAESKVGEVVTVSAGVSGGIMVADVGPEEVVAQADEALYRSKQSGRNRVSVFGE